MEVCTMSIYDPPYPNEADEGSPNDSPFRKDGDRVDLSELRFRTLSDPLYWLKNDRFGENDE